MLYRMHTERPWPNTQPWFNSCAYTAGPMPPARDCVALKATNSQDLPPILPILCFCLYNLFLTYCILFCCAIYDVSSNYQAQPPRGASQSTRRKIPLVLNISSVESLDTAYDSPALCTGADRSAVPPVGIKFPLNYGVVLMKFNNFTVLVVSGSRRCKIDRLGNNPKSPADTITRPVAAQTSCLVGIKLSWKKKRQSKSHALHLRPGSNDFAWIAVWVLDPESLIDDPNTLFFKELNLARGIPGWPLSNIQNCGGLRYIPQPICVPWASPSLRQNIIAEVLSCFRCISKPGTLHDFIKCYTPKRERSRLAVGSLLRSSNPQLQLPSASVRSLAGGSQKDSHRRTSTQSTTTTSSKKPLTKWRETSAKQPWDEEEGRNSDEDQPEGTPAPKRKRGENRDGLPCIFHIFDRIRYMYGDWKHCNPNVSTYSNPSDLMRHLPRKHEIENDEFHLWRKNSPISLCKNCWTQYMEPNEHWVHGKASCNKPFRKISQMEKWWAAYEMFCGPRTTAAAEYLESLVSEEHRQMSRQLGLDAQQRANQGNLQANKVGFSPATGIPGPSSWQGHREASPTPSGHLIRGYFSQEAGFSSIQPSFPSTNGDSSNQSQDQSYGTSLQPQPDSHFAFEPQPKHLLQSVQNNDDNMRSLAQWQPQSPPNALPQSPPWPTSPLQLNGDANFLDLWTRLHLVEKEKEQVEEENRGLREASRQHAQREQRLLDIIDKLSSKEPIITPSVHPENNNVSVSNCISAPARSNTDSSTASILSGIAERNTSNLGTIEQFNEDLAYGLLLEEEVLEETPAAHSQDPREVQYIPELELGVPRALQGMPSLDSGYGTNEMDHQFVNPADTVLAPSDLNLGFSHT